MVTDDEKQILTLLFTDGEPTRMEPQFHWTSGTTRSVCVRDDVRLRKTLVDIQRIWPKSYISIVLCTSDDAVVSLYNEIDVGVPRLDVIDDYRSERSQIWDYQGRGFKFSKQDWVVKMLLGPKIRLWDLLDERRLSKSEIEVFKKYTDEWKDIIVPRKLTSSWWSKRPLSV